MISFVKEFVLCLCYLLYGLLKILNVIYVLIFIILLTIFDITRMDSTDGLSENYLAAIDAYPMQRLLWHATFSLKGEMNLSFESRLL